MSLKALIFVGDRSYGKPASRKLVMLAIADVADDHGRAFPAISTIAEYAEIGERQAQNVIRSLEGDGHLTIKTSGGYETVYGSTNLYTITGIDDWISALPRDPIKAKPTVEGVNHSTPDGVNAVTPVGVNHSTPKQSSLNSHSKQSVKRKQIPAIAGSQAAKPLTEQQMFYEQIQRAYKGHPGIVGELAPGLAGQIASMFRGKSKSRKLATLKERPFSLIELRAFFFWMRQNGNTLPLTNTAHFEQKIVDFRASVDHDAAIRAIMKRDEYEAAKAEIEANAVPVDDTSDPASPERIDQLQAEFDALLKKMGD